MEKYVELLSTRLDNQKKGQLLEIMDCAINEMHNNGILRMLPPEEFKLVHDPDPNVRINEKVIIARSVAHSFFNSKRPLITADGEFGSIVTLEFHPEFVNSICLLIQSDLEDFYISKAYNLNKSGVFRYIVKIKNYNEITDLFLRNIERLNQMYDNFSLDIKSYEFEPERIENSKASREQMNAIMARLIGDTEQQKGNTEQQKGKKARKKPRHRVVNKTMFAGLILVLFGLVSPILLVFINPALIANPALFAVSLGIIILGVIVELIGYIGFKKKQ